MGKISSYPVASTLDDVLLVGSDSADANATVQVPTSLLVTYIDEQIVEAGGYNDEQAQDAVGAMVTARFTYTDATPSLDLSAGVQTSLGLADTAVQPATTFKEYLTAVIEAPADGDYRLVVNCPYGFTISSVTTRCVSGTCTATTKINTTALGGTANSVSSSEQAQAHGSSNVLATGDDIVLTISSNSSCVRMTWTLAYTRAINA